MIIFGNLFSFTNFFLTQVPISLLFDYLLKNLDNIRANPSSLSISHTKKPLKRYFYSHIDIEEGLSYMYIFFSAYLSYSSLVRRWLQL